MKVFVAVALAIFATASAQSRFQCPPNAKDNQYEDSVQCDKYYQCVDGVATEKLCPDGLVFDQAIRKVNKCDQPFNIDCGERTELQTPKGNNNCPRRNGFFAHPDPAVCNKFYNCIDGDFTELPCTNGLYFDEYSGNCVWPETAQRQGCVDKSKQLDDGFACPKENSADHTGQVVVHPKYPHPTDCQKFYVCLNGLEPRALGCTTGEVYNDETQRCDAPENVPGCEDWYATDDKKN